MTDFLQPAGIVVLPSALTLPRSLALAGTLGLGRLPFVKLIDCLQHHSEGDELEETVVFEVEVERPQRRAHDIHRTERLAATFKADDDWYPEVVSLRPDFPRVPHINLRADEFPRSLCLYEEAWSQVSLRWTPAAFIDRIRSWLTETAKGTLHQEDQPLEPLLFGSGYKIVLPAGFYDDVSADGSQELRIAPAHSGKDCRVFIAEAGAGDGGMPFLALSLVAQPQMHGAIRHAPRDLRQLDEFLSPAGIPLIEVLHAKLADWNQKDMLDKNVLLIIAFPLMRAGQAFVESTDLWMFLTTKSVAEVGVGIGLWEKTSHGLGTPLSKDPGADGSSIPLDILSPHFDLSRARAAASSGVVAEDREMVAVGAGALGSQTLRLLAQSGFGRWCVVDEDVLLPHNVARHSLDSGVVGFPKAVAVAAQLRRFYAEEGPLSFVEADVLRPSTKKDELEKRLGAASLILDMAASIPVSRYLAHDAPGGARRVALFLNPQGIDLVQLTEDAHRASPLDCLEMQYYRSICQIPELHNHLAPPPGRLRYARSCRDVSSSIPNSAVSMHAAIGSEAIRQAVKDESATINIWHSDPQTLEVRLFNVTPSPVHRNAHGPWTLVVDATIQRRIAELRQSKLPSETGGVLLGAYDLERKIVYVVETIPSPPDSEEWPTLYIRGKKGLAAEVEKVSAITDGQLEYIGEWHSHPDGCPCRPSDDDIEVFNWLTANMDDAGLPALMAIAGQGPVVAWYLGEMVRSGGWELGT